MKTNKLLFLIITFALFLITGCSEDYFNVKTTATLTAENAATTMETDPSKLSGFVDAIYNTLIQWDLVGTSHDAFGLMATLHATDMMTEDIVMAKLHWFSYDYLLDNRDWTYRRTRVYWTYMYSTVAGANTVLGLTSPESDDSQIKFYRGQALALRGMSYLYLIQGYQHLYPISSAGEKPGIPLFYASNEGKENISGRAPVKDVLAQIESDLTTAADNLKGLTRKNKNQVDYFVVNGFLSRYYMLTEQWDKAIAASQEAQKGAQQIMPSSELFDGFMDINGTEVMWGFDHNAETSSLYASFFSHISNLTGGYAGLNYAPRLIDKRLYDYIPDTDARKQLFQDANASIVVTKNVSPEAIGWKTPYANLKFGSDGKFTQDYTYMRVSEMVLNEAEALAHKGDGSGAATVLKKLMSKRDPAWNKASVTVDDVWMQRRIELWGEGFAYYDLKRLNKGIDRTYAGSNHEPSRKIKVDAGDKRWIYQIPQTEIQENPEISEEQNNE